MSKPDLAPRPAWYGSLPSRRGVAAARPPAALPGGEALAAALPLTHPALAAAGGARSGRAAGADDARPPRAAPVVAIPRGEWPVWAVAVAKLAAPEDHGVGDTVARVVGPFGGHAFRRWSVTVLGRECGCARRQAEWNAAFPYPPRD